MEYGRRCIRDMKGIKIINILVFSWDTSNIASPSYSNVHTTLRNIMIDYDYDTYLNKNEKYRVFSVYQGKRIQYTHAQNKCDLFTVFNTYS